jgi:hypothetical protein
LENGVLSASEDWAANAVYGARPIRCSRRAAPGIVRYSNPSQATDSYELLSCITLDELFEHYDPEGMGYEMFGSWTKAMVGDHSAVIQQCFESVRDVYGSAVAHGEGVLVVSIHFGAELGGAADCGSWICPAPAGMIYLVGDGGRRI